MKHLTFKYIICFLSAMAACSILYALTAAYTCLSPPSKVIYEVIDALKDTDDTNDFTDLPLWRIQTSGVSKALSGNILSDLKLERHMYENDHRHIVPFLQYALIRDLLQKNSFWESFGIEFDTMEKCAVRYYGVHADYALRKAAALKTIQDEDIETLLRESITDILLLNGEISQKIGFPLTLAMYNKVTANKYLEEINEIVNQFVNPILIEPSYVQKRILLQYMKIVRRLKYLTDFNASKGKKQYFAFEVHFKDQEEPQQFIIALLHLHDDGTQKDQLEIGAMDAWLICKTLKILPFGSDEGTIFKLPSEKFNTALVIPATRAKTKPETLDHPLFEELPQESL